MIAQQVAGKATRDALFLTSFEVTSLPPIMAASAVLSIISAVWLSKMILRHTPEKVVPASFAVSGIALLAAWALAFPAPRLAAIVVYLHAALFGSSVISAFWAFVNERFDPRRGKRAVSLIAAGGTLGGVLGGVLAWRAASVIAVPTMLPLLAALNVVCVWGSLRSRNLRSLPSAELPTERQGGRDSDAESIERVSLAELSPLRIFREAPYLQHLAFVVALGAITSGLLDYVFSAAAARVYSEGPYLLSFFAFFWLLVGIVSFALQMLLGSIALEKLGLAVTVALLPGVVVLGGVFGLAVPGLASTASLRGGEAALRNSLFRASYELLYTPLSEQKRRSTKLLVDVGFDRLGTIAASAIVFVTLALQPDGERAVGILLVLCMACALATLARSRALQVGYVAVLEGSLRQEAERLESKNEAFEPHHAHAGVAAHDKVVDHLNELPRSVELATFATVEAKLVAVPLAVAAPAPVDVTASLAEALGRIQELCSGDPLCVRRVLGAETPLAAPLVSPAILLLASREFHSDAIRALRKVAPRATGQLADALRDPSVGFDIRRRIPRVLSACPTQAAADALILGTHDERFEVRYECGRALLRITAAESSIEVSLPTVIEIVRREVEQSKQVWDSQREPEFDEEENEPPALIDRLLRDRFDRSLEHVFSILALVLDRESIRIAFKALHQDDARLRGTALEYLETVLPEEARDAVWPFLGEERPRRPARPATEILADLTSAREAPKSQREKE